MRIINSEIQIIADNNAADWNNPVSSDSSEWKAIMPNGALVSPGTSGTLKYSTDQVTTLFANCAVTPPANSSGILLMESLGLLPHADSKDYANDKIWLSHSGECIPFRGGRFDVGDDGGIFSLYLYTTRWTSTASLGFRCAYISLT